MLVALSFSIEAASLDKEHEKRCVADFGDGHSRFMRIHSFDQGIEV